MSDTDQLTLFTCGKKPIDHQCNTDGPFIYGGDDVPTTDDEAKAKSTPGYSWGSATCSKCGQAAFANLW